MKKHKENHNRVGGVINVIKFHVNLHKFSFDFLGVNKVDFKNYFANELINIGRFLSHLKHL